MRGRRIGVRAARWAGSRNPSAGAGDGPAQTRPPRRAGLGEGSAQSREMLQGGVEAVQGSRGMVQGHRAPTAGLAAFRSYRGRPAAAPRICRRFVSANAQGHCPCVPQFTIDSAMSDPAANLKMPQPLGLFAGELYYRGIQYLDAAGQLDYKNNKNSLMPGSFLISHALELILKSYLAASGVDKKKIRHAYGHKINEIYGSCIDCGLPQVNNLDKLVTNLHEMNRDYDFRYPTGYSLVVIAPAEAIAVVKILSSEIRPLIERISLDARFQFASDTRHLRGAKIEWAD